MQVNGVDVTDARHDEVIRLLTSDRHQEFTIVVYRDPNHPLSPTSSPRGNLFMPPQSPVNMTVESPSYPTSSSVVKRPSPGPQLHISTTAGSPSSPAFVPRPPSAEIGRSPPAVSVRKSLHAVDAGISSPAAVKTVTYNIGDSASTSVEPPMPLMMVQQDRPPMSPRASTGVEPVTKIPHGIPCHDGNLLFATPPAPAGTSSGSGVSDLFSALEKTYHTSQQGDPVRSQASYDASTGSAAPLLRGQSSASADRKRSREVSLV